METEIDDTQSKTINQGANVRKLRQILGVKQETLANALNTNQQKISRIEQTRLIDEPTLIKIAEVLNISPKIIQELEENPTSIVIENNTFQSGSSNTGMMEIQHDNNDNRVIHPIEKVTELSKELSSIYERMLAIEKEKIAILEQFLKEKK